MKCLQRLILTSSRLLQRTWSIRQLHHTSSLLSNKKAPEKNATFDSKMLDILACPLSKKPLWYNEENNELVSDEIGVAYPIVDGIPNLNPIHGRVLNKS